MTERTTPRHAAASAPGRRRPAAGLPVARAAASCLLAGVACVAADAGAAGLAGPGASVEAGRDALADQWDLPWYDAQADRFRPIKLPRPRQSRASGGSLSWLGDFIDGIGDFFRWLGGWGGNALVTGLRLLTWAGLLALAGWLVYKLIVALRRMELSEAEDLAAEQERTRVAQVEQLPIALERGLRDLAGEARRRFEAGDRTMAVVYLFSHQLLVLDRRRLLRLVKGKTNRQYLRELRRATPDRPHLATTFAETTLLFERAFFGAHAPDAAQLEQLLEGVDAFDAAAAATGEA